MTSPKSLFLSEFLLKVAKTDVQKQQRNTAMSSLSAPIQPEGAKTVQIQVQSTADTIRMYHVDLTNLLCPVDVCILPGSAGSFKVSPLLPPTQA